jgi:hypothetical protein
MSTINELLLVAYLPCDRGFCLLADGSQSLSELHESTGDFDPVEEKKERIRQICSVCLIHLLYYR